MKVRVPYDKGYLYIDIDENQVKAVLKSGVEEYDTNERQEDIVRKALKNPIASGTLGNLAKGAKKILLITSDHTRPVPSKVTLPVLLNEVRSHNPGVSIKILIATGFHRATTYEEILDKFGREIVEKEEIIVHDSRDTDNMVFKGILPSGAELWVNSLVDWADLVVAEGFIEPHFFAGFSGGRKSILPGIAAEKTVMSNHCSKFIDSDKARTGKLEDNPIHKDMLLAAEAVKLAFILNVIINGEKKIIHAFAGNYIKAHKKGCEFVQKLAGVETVQSDIVITSNGGYPLDQNIYQAVKGMTAAEACVKNGGVIIIAASCKDGHGGEAFYRWFKDSATPEEVAQRISAIPQEETLPDQWEAQILARVLLKAEVIMVSEECSRAYIQDMHMTWASSIDEALKIAEGRVGKGAGIVVIPDGVSVICGARHLTY